MFASHGFKVVGTDYNRELVKTLQSGKTTFEEDGLDELFKKAVLEGIKFSDKYINTDVYIIAVQTPYDKSTKKIDPSYVVNAIKDVMKVCVKGATVIVESTISPGTIDKFVRPTVQAKGFIIGKDINIVHAPERIIPGNMVFELKNNSRTIGADNKSVGKIVKSMYSSFCQGKIVVTDIHVAEMTKVVENTFRDINIAFANELMKICRLGNMDVYEIIKIANMHPRVNILQPGPGVGGHCISVDPWFLVGDYPGLANIILSARRINDSMPKFVLERIHDIMKEKNITDLTRIGLYGLTYKENVDDIRESPTLQLIEIMERHLAKPLKTYDPNVKNDIVENQYHDFDEFLNSIDIVVIMVAHDEIRENVEKLRGKIVLDTRNIDGIKDWYKL
ncbi:NDP-N-acetyl-D-galactosaminuronic acid dehydrogenase [Clostridium botulinum B str. Osaka05]|uniref:NDP-N-acetyl-D-galactosaminuronic acid dehydrogenase n=2 Tax=Clostridium botulinum TaxID=1491 RepID=A0A0S6U7F3_CLOBO|nr:NDP-N-acetyl-D-galactosaminuronic acid dehydrogenase [Clostridium botulinum B str. Osaka05]